MSKANLRRLAILGVVFSFTALSAFADPVFIGSDNSGAEPLNGKATFSFGAGTLTITLENTAGPGQLDAIGSLLDGIRFTLSSGSLTLTSVSAPDVIDCSGGSCISVSGIGSPYDWTYNSGLLAAGAGSFKPYAIVDENLELEDGIGNGPHNPYLLGPVIFSFTLTGGPASGEPTVSDVVFYFGTAPDTTPGHPPNVPEPLTLIFLGSGLLGLGLLRRKSS